MTHTRHHTWHMESIAGCLLALAAMTSGCGDDSGSGGASVCNGVSCSGQGKCLVDDQGGPYCQCDPGYEALGLSCIQSSQTLCGNGTIDAEETCDDGNKADGDGCSKDCQTEQGWTCDGTPSSCSPICGDGHIIENETCDDGNQADGDGCSKDCQTEQGWTCDGTPSSCSPICGDGLCRTGESMECPRDCLVDIEAGTHHTCALTQEGAVWCWGANYNYQLGDGTNTNHSTPTLVQGLPENPPATFLVAGEGHNCVILRDGSVWCWGRNYDGELGDGTTGDKQYPVQVQNLPANSQATSVVLGWDHTCVLLQDASAWCWGGNNHGQLGNGTFVGSPYPARIDGFPQGAHVTALAASSNHTCAALQDGSAWCWGYNEYGQLGNGTTQDSSQPVQVQGLPQGPGISSITAAPVYNCALLQVGSAWCWGGNSDGQLGNGTTQNSSPPVQVQGLPSSAPISMLVTGGGYHTCALLQDGSAWCWGDNAYGQLGNGTTQDSTQPVQVRGLPPNTAVSTLSIGMAHTCALLQDGSAWCWGQDEEGQLGDGNATNVSLPTPVHWEP